MSRSKSERSREAVREAVAQAGGLEPAEPAPRSKGQDPFTGGLRRREVLPLLVLHLISEGPSYGNQLMERIGQMTAGVLTVNPNTMYPLLRRLESQGLIQGNWEHPERRTRRYYSLTGDGRAEYERLRRGGAALPRLGRDLDRRDRARGVRRLRTARAEAEVVLTPEAALRLWTDVSRWPTFVEGFAHVARAGPATGRPVGAAGVAVHAGRSRPGDREGGGERPRSRRPRSSRSGWPAARSSGRWRAREGAGWS